MLPSGIGLVSYLYLAIAIVAEVITTSFLKQSNGFTRLVPTLIMAAGYMVAFYCLSLALRGMPTGVAYAIWSGAGIVLIAGIAWIFQGAEAGLARDPGHGADHCRGDRDEPFFPGRSTLTSGAAFGEFLPDPVCMAADRPAAEAADRRVMRAVPMHGIAVRRVPVEMAEHGLEGVSVKGSHPGMLPAEAS